MGLVTAGDDWKRYGRWATAHKQHAHLRAEHEYLLIIASMIWCHCIDRTPPLRTRGSSRLLAC